MSSEKINDEESKTKENDGGEPATETPVEAPPEHPSEGPPEHPPEDPPEHVPENTEEVAQPPADEQPTEIPEPAHDGVPAEESESKPVEEVILQEHAGEDLQEAKHEEPREEEMHDHAEGDVPLPEMTSEVHPEHEVEYIDDDEKEFETLFAPRELEPMDSQHAIATEIIRDILGTIKSTESLDSNQLMSREIIDDIVEKFEDSHSIAQEVIYDIIDKFESLHGIARGFLDDIVERMDSPTNIAQDVILGIVDKFESAHGISRDIICDIVESFDSANKISRDIVDEIVDMTILECSEKFGERLTVKYSSVKEEIRKIPPECVKYMGVESVAHDTITSVVTETREKLLISEMVEYCSEENVPKFVETLEKQASKWPTIQHFTIDEGLSAIRKFLNVWEFNEEWLFNIEFLMPQSNECSDFYLYEVKCSIPTKEYPVPQATASVYFTIEVSRVLPVKCPVTVTYVFEGKRLVHDCRIHIFEEDWLFNIIDAKIALLKRINF